MLIQYLKSNCKSNVFMYIHALFIVNKLKNGKPCTFCQVNFKCLSSGFISIVFFLGGYASFCAPKSKLLFVCKKKLLLYFRSKLFI
jgi:hypothetical protein